MVCGDGGSLNVGYYDPSAITHLITGHPTVRRLVNADHHRAWQEKMCSVCGARPASGGGMRRISRSVAQSV